MFHVIYGRYEVRSDGRIFSFHLEDFLKLSADSSGYLCCNLWDGEEYHKHRVHSLVAKLFIPNPKKKPQVNHKDGNRLNAHISNLEWVTASENNQHAHDTIPRKTVRKLSLEAIDHIVNSGLSTTQLMELYPVSRQHINSLKRGKYHVEYTRNINDD